MSKAVKELVKKIEDLGWSVEDEGDNQFRLGKFSPSGQDFGISIEGEDVKHFIDNIYKAYEDFDVSEETYLWLDHDGHGKNGAPYHMKDVLLDMEACEQMILELYEGIR